MILGGLMSYFEELWSAGKEEENAFPQDVPNEPNIFSIFDPEQLESTSPLTSPSINTKEEIFFTPQNIVSPPNLEPTPTPILHENLDLDLEGITVGGDRKSVV